MDYYTRIYKGVKKCPCCGGVAYFGIESGCSYAIQCGDCGLSSKPVSLPSYWSKGSNRMYSRLFMRTLIPWNKRVENNP